MIKLNNIKPTNYNYKIIKILRIKNYLLIWFNNGDKKIINLKDFDINNIKLSINKIILSNNVELDSNYLYNNSLLIYNDNVYIPQIKKITNLDDNLILAGYVNGELRLYDTSKYLLNGYIVCKYEYEDIYKYGKEILNIEIRKANSEDARKIVEINIKEWKNTYKDIFPDEFLNELNSKMEDSIMKCTKKINEYIVCESNNEVVGFLRCGRNKKNYNDEYSEIYSLYVSKEY